MNTNSPLILLLICCSCLYATISMAQPNNNDNYNGGFERYGEPVQPQNPPPPPPPQNNGFNNNYVPPPPPQNGAYNNYPQSSNGEQVPQSNTYNPPQPYNPNYPPQQPAQNTGFEYNGQPLPAQQPAQPPVNQLNEKSVLTNSGFEGWDIEEGDDPYTDDRKKKKRKKKRKNKNKKERAKKNKRSKSKKKKDVIVQKNVQPKSLGEESFAPNSPNTIQVNLDGLYAVDIAPAVEIKGKRNKALSFKTKEDIKYLFNQSILKVNAKDFETALVYLDKCVDAEPFNKEYLQMRGNVFSELGKYKKAIKDYQKAIDANRTDALLHYNKASTLLKMNKLKDAIKAYDQAILIDPAYINALQGRASAKTLLGDYASSINDYNRVLDQASFFIPALKGRGVSKSLVGRYDEAVNDFTFIIQKQPMDGMAYYYRGLAYVGMNQVYQGCSDFDKAYQLKVPQAYYEIKETCR